MAYVICNKCKHVFPFPFLTSFPFESPDIPGLHNPNALNADLWIYIQRYLRRNNAIRNVAERSRI